MVVNKIIGTCTVIMITLCVVSTYTMHIAVKKPCCAKLKASASGIRATIINQLSNEVVVFFHGATKVVFSTKKASSLATFRLSLMPKESLFLGNINIGVDETFKEDRAYSTINLAAATHFSIDSRNEVDKIPIECGAVYILKPLTEQKQ